MGGTEGGGDCDSRAGCLSDLLQPCVRCKGPLQVARSQRPKQRGRVLEALLCDGPCHQGSRELGQDVRYSCEACDRDYCLPCATEVLPRLQLRRISVFKLNSQPVEGGLSEADDLGQGFRLTRNHDGRIWETRASQRRDRLQPVAPRTQTSETQTEMQDGDCARTQLADKRRKLSEGGELAAGSAEAKRLSFTHDEELSQKKADSKQRSKQSTIDRLTAKMEETAAQAKATRAEMEASDKKLTLALNHQTSRADRAEDRVHQHESARAKLEVRLMKANSEKAAALREVEEREADLMAERTLQDALESEVTTEQLARDAEAARHRQAETEAAERIQALQAQLDAGTRSEVKVVAKVLGGSIRGLERQQHGGRGVPKGGLISRLEKSERKLKSLKGQVGVQSAKVPPRSFSEGDRHAYNDNVTHISTVLKDRPPTAISAALERNGQIEALLQTKKLQSHVKTIIAGVLAVIQKHWGARHAVIVMSEVHTSRSEFDTLRHLLSFIYDRDTDMYRRIAVWTNPFAPDDQFVPTLASRKPREEERAAVYSKCEAVASDDGMFCGLDNLEKAAAGMVSHYWDALDPAVQVGANNLMLVLTGDATGGWRGDSVTHGELGIGSWRAGKAQSKLTLLPLFIMEGDDGAKNLRNQAARVAEMYNALKRKGTLTVVVGETEIVLRVDLRIAADFQFFKAILNMSKYSSAIWCMCTLDNLFKVPASRAETWEEVRS